MIDKLSPKKYVSSKDERLIQPSEMIDATNVSISERGDGSGAILKTMGGHLIGTKNSDDVDLNATIKTVVGRVSDEQRGFVYFWVAGNSSADDAIYQYDTNLNQFRLVLKNTWLNLDKNRNVQADLINKDINRDNTLQTILYWTDNFNEPRRINVDRALNGDYDGKSSSFLDTALNVIKRPSLIEPTWQFNSNSNFEENNFYNNYVQIATQIVYKDNEVSVLSPYSKIAISASSVFGAIESAGYGQARFAQNELQIRHNVPDNHPDLKAVRLLSRSGNDGNWHVIDEFDPTTDVTRQVFGSSVKVYDSATKKYLFYNESLGRAIPSQDALRVFDNVPRLAEGISIAGSRLMFSNYEEGRGNFDISASITPIYNRTNAGSSSLTDSDDTLLSFTNGDINFVGNLETNTTAITSATQIINSGTFISFSFIWKPEFTVSKTGGGALLSFAGLAPDEYTIASLALTNIQDATKVKTFSFVTTEDKTVHELAEFIQGQLEDDQEEFYTSYTVGSTTATKVSDSSTFQTQGTVRCYWKFSEIETVFDGTAGLTFTPRIDRIELINWNAPGSSNYVTPNQESVLAFTPTAHANFVFTEENQAMGSEVSYEILNGGDLSSFKAGALHDFGVVYFDKYGRAGFVNPLGTAYAKLQPERSANEYGPVSMRFNFAANATAPSWADHYKIVYAGSSVADTFQYTVGGAYAKRKREVSSNIFDLDDSSHNIYVSLKTLDQYKDNNDVPRAYSFTKGDKLRIISRRNDQDNGLVYELDSQNNIIEFDVLGFITADGHPVQIRDHNGITSNFEDEKNPYKGSFLVLSAPRVDATLGDGANVLKYEGYDWNSITNTAYNGSVASPDLNKWNRGVLVEVITPRESVSEKIYYEIGEGRKLGASRITPSPGVYGQSITTNSGDVYYRPVNCRRPNNVGGGGAWKALGPTASDNVGGITATANLPNYNTEENPETWVAEARYIESSDINDLFPSKHWNKGRPHTVFKDAAEVRRFNGITYSEAYADDTAELTLSKFVPASANFFDLPSENGICSFIGRTGDALIAVQEDRCSRLLLNKDIIRTGDESGLVSLSTQVLGNPSFYMDNLGSKDPSSVLTYGGVTYIFDAQRHCVAALTDKGADIISERGIKSAFQESANAYTVKHSAGRRIVSGYDPEDSIYYITFVSAQSGSQGNITYGYNTKGEFWQGKYTFAPHVYATCDNKLILGQTFSTSPNNFVFVHNGTTSSNDFFGAASRAQSSFTVVSVADPSMVKAYDSVSIESDSAWSVSLESSSGQTTGALTLSEKEDAFYGAVTGDTSTNSKGHYIPVGTIAANGVDGATITMTNSLRGMHIPKNYKVSKAADANSYTDFSAAVSSVNYADKKITFDGSVAANLSAGDRVFIRSEKALNGDQIRGHYCKITCSITPTGTNQEELHVVNAKYVESRANHRIA